MIQTYQPAGIYSAQWIPVTASGSLDRPALTRHVAFERGAGVRGFLALGSTGEFPRFSAVERKTVLAILAELADPLPVIANISDLRPQTAIELGHFARDLGLAAVALMPPTFYPVSPPDMLAYFLHVAEQVELPVMLYNFPELAGNRIGLEVVAEFAARAPLIAIKQSGGEFAYHRELIPLGRELGFAVMSGADTRLPEAFGLGAAGCIGGLVNIVPEIMVEIDRCCREGGAADCEPAASRMREVGRIVDRLSFPLNVGAALDARGLSAGPPKMPVSPQSGELYAGIVRELSAAFAAWELAPAT